MTKAQRALFKNQLTWNPQSEPLTCRIRAERRYITLRFVPYGPITGLFAGTKADRVRETIAGADGRLEQLRKIIRQKSWPSNMSKYPTPFGVWVEAIRVVRRARFDMKPTDSSYSRRSQIDARLTDQAEKRLMGLIRANPRFVVIPQSLAIRYRKQASPYVWINGNTKYGRGYVNIQCTCLPKPAASGWIQIGQDGEELRFNSETLQYTIWDPEANHP